MKRTFNIELVNKIVTHPEIYPLITDDGSVSVEDYCTSDSDSIYYLLGDEGLIIYTPLNLISYETHWCILPAYWGKSKSFIKESINWMFANTQCMKIEGRIPEYNKRAYVQAKKVGFSDEGLSKSSIMKDGKLFNMNIMGVTNALGSSSGSS